MSMTQWHAQDRGRESLHALCHYQLEVQECVSEDDFNAASPLPVTVVQSSPLATCLAAETDQSGLIGLIRYLHQQGLLLLSLYRTPIKTTKEHDHAC